MGYFINDTANILVKKKYQLTDYAFIFHHLLSISAIIFIYIDMYTFFIIKMFIMGEFSNYPLYIAYHINKTKPNSDLYRKVLKIEFLHYSFFRIVGFGYLGIDEIITNGYDWYIIPGLALYAMGCYWSYKLYKSIVTIKYD